MPYIGNTTSDFSIDTGNITNRAVTALKLSPSSVGSNGQVLGVDGSGNLQWTSDPAGQWITSGSDIYFDGGDVGIGTSSPDTLFHLEATNTPSSINNVIRISDADTSVVANQVCGRIEFETADTGNPGVNCQIDTIYSGNGGGGELQLRTGFAGSLVNALRIDDTGKVGIGTTSPAGKLEINAGSSGTDVTVLRFDSDSGGAFNIQCSDASSGTPLWKFDLGLSEALQIDSAATTRFLSGSGDSAIAIGKTGAANDAVVLKYDESGDKLHFYGWGGSEGDILTLDNGNSRVGIGTASPGKKLEITTTGSSGEGILLKATDSTYPSVIGDANRSGSSLFLLALQGYWNGNRVAEVTCESGPDTTNKDDGIVVIRTRNHGDSSPQDRVTVTETGNVGIGTTSPAVVLHAQQFNHAFASSTNSLATVITKSLARFQGSNDSSDSLWIGTAAADAQPYLQGCNSGGNNAKNILLNPFGAKVGIGTTSPNQQLHVNNSATDSSCYLKVENNRSRNAAIQFTTTQGSWYVGQGIGADVDRFMIYDSAEKFSVDANGHAKIHDGNLVVANGHGIDFSAQTGTSASGAATGAVPAEVLSHYEEGTWDPVATFSTSGSVTLGGGGHFTRVGRIVTITWTFYTTSISSPSGNFSMGGLPFACYDHSHARFGASFAFVREWNTDMPNFRGLISAGSQMVFYKQATNGETSDRVVGSDFEAGNADNYIYGSATYMAA